MNKVVTVAVIALLGLSAVGCTQSGGKDAVPSQVQTQQDTGGGQPVSQLVYRNTDYGFEFTLPTSWQGYQIVPGQWQGLAIAGSGGEVPVATGPMISIRHPAWTAQVPRQDIPIMVFTSAQWQSLQADEFHIGAAPVRPSELGHNSKYVFALPARYNFAFPPGYEEVEQILAGNPLRAIEPQAK